MENPGMPASLENNRLCGLDVLRGLAVLMVVASHFFPRYMPNEIMDSIVHSLGIGGVILFFNLSGFLVYKSIVKLPVRIFIIRRIAKIFPAYWATIALYVFFLINEHDNSISIKFYIANILMLQELVGGALLLGHFWTLAVEVKFYAIIATLAPIIRKSFTVVPLILILLANMLFYVKFGRGSTLLTNMPIFFSGVLVYASVENRWQRADFLKLGLYVLLVPTSMLIFQQYNCIDYAIYAWVSVLALCLALVYPMKNRPLSYFGRISYSLYLLHPVVGFRSEILLTELGLPNFVATIVAILTSVVFADLFYRLIEVPSVRLGRKLGGFQAKVKPA